MKKKYTLLSVAILFSATMFGQVLFEKTYTNFTEARKMAITSDGGCIVAGRSSYLGNSDMAMLKLDVDGNVQWCHAYGNGNDIDYAESVTQTLDGGYLLVGVSNTDCFYVRTDAAGTVIWSKYYTPGNVKRALDVIAVSDSTYIVTGGDNSSVTNTDAGIIHLSKTGAVLWSYAIPNQNWTCCTYKPQLYKVIKLKNSSNYVAVGSYMSSSNQDGYLIKFKASGALVLERKDGGNNRYYNLTQLASDGNLVLVGRNVVTKIDTAGNLIWTRTYDDQLGSSAYTQSVSEAPNGDLLILSYSYSSAVTSIITANSFGIIQSTRNLTNFGVASTRENNVSILPTPDGAYICAVNNRVKKVSANLSSACGTTSFTFTGIAGTLNMNTVVTTKTTTYGTPSKTFINGVVPSVATTVCSTTAFSFTTTQSNPSCNGQCTGTASASASGGTSPYTYSWSAGGVSTGSVSALCAGTYTVKITDATGSTLTKTVGITQPAVLVASNVSTTNPLCFGGSTGSACASASGGTPAYTYQWNTGQTNTCTTGLIAGTYTLTVTDNNGCTSTLTTSITQPAALVVNTSATSVTSGCNGTATGTSSGGTGSYTYSWSGGQTASTATNLCTGNYTITVTDANGCTSTATVFVPSTVGVNEMSADDIVLISPNPFSSLITITGKQSQVEIINVLGEQVYLSATNSTKQQIDLSKQPSGIYFIKVTSEAGILTRKLIKN